MNSFLIWRSPAAGRAVLATLLLATSCVSTEHEVTAPTTPRTEFTPPSGKGQRVSQATVLNTVQTAHAFTSAATTDRFVLQLRGPRVLTGKLHFAVLNSQGDTLHREVLPARLLQDPNALTVREQEISVLRGMNGFFNTNRFITPAVPATVPDKPAALSPKAWNSLRANTQAVGFEYPSAAGSMRRLVYVPELHQAVVLAE